VEVASLANELTFNSTVCIQILVSTKASDVLNEWAIILTNVTSILANSIRNYKTQTCRLFESSFHQICPLSRTSCTSGKNNGLNKLVFRGSFSNKSGLGVVTYRVHQSVAINVSA